MPMSQWEHSTMRMLLYSSLNSLLNVFYKTGLSIVHFITDEGERYTFRGSNSVIFNFASLLNLGQLLTLLHPELPKLLKVLAVLNVVGLKVRICSLRANSLF